MICQSVRMTVTSTPLSDLNSTPLSDLNSTPLSDLNLTQKRVKSNCVELWGVTPRFIRFVKMCPSATLSVRGHQATGDKQSRDVPKYPFK